MIRLAQPSDAQAIAQVYRPIVEETAISLELVPPSAEQLAARIAATLEWTPWLVREEDGCLQGYAYASRHRDRAGYQWSVDVSVYVDSRAHRRGVGRALYSSLFTLLRRQGFFVAHAGVTLPNLASVGLHEALGFRPIGVYPSVGYKLGAWRDVGWWQLPLSDRPAHPETPISLPQLCQTPGWDRALAPEFAGP